MKVIKKNLKQEAPNHFYKKGKVQRGHGNHVAQTEKSFVPGRVSTKKSHGQGGNRWDGVGINAWGLQVRGRAKKKQKTGKRGRVSPKSYPNQVYMGTQAGGKGGGKKKR